MKPKMLREHFRYYKTNRIWIPKKAFASEEEVLTLGFDKYKWRHYTCGFCNEIHVTRRKG